MENLSNGLEVLSNVIDEAMTSNNIVKYENIGLFTIKTGNEWMEEAKNKPVPKKLFGEFWFEGELCILFADSNVGKSILAVQIADSISKNKEITPFKLDAEKQAVLYLDFELSAKQFENRYSKNYDEHYYFDNGFSRIEINSDADLPSNTDFETYLLNSLEWSIAKTGAKTIIVDNLTYLKSGNESAKDALPLMKKLKALKSKYDLSMLVLAHTPKRDLSKAITKNDLAGSKMLMNFCDSSFTIGQSSADSSLRYIKQIKQRNTEEIYGADNVCVCQIIKPHNFLEFEFLDFDEEKTHLKESNKVDKADRDELIELAKELSDSGKTQREISDELGIAVGTVNKYLKL
ncbi:AAA family ATPase [Flavobacterium tructae]|uniref:LuxR family transcriptional regulator n=1 Tax=Flavobacterium tructae TaxID=1114873 RepID=A0A1S1J4P5_9FLAO|nr:AAA family ATPase [Flavobacterium tructae]OHT45622.1 LuxR family transcriptional regulator [Flavobacterium tructae]OXB18280.1 LuxR family transcriptional regulator [Flavobacterium tructae]